ncbi:MAG: hypothetical protein Kow0069_00830 [Promethearchaeota archaeon]
MGRRKRKKVVYRRVPRLPKIFTCPQCGKRTVKTIIKKDDGTAIVRCGSCGVEEEVLATELTEPVDAFGDFVDIFYAQQEYERLTQRAQVLERHAQWSELVAVYSYLADICELAAASELKSYEEDNDPVHMEQVNKWRAEAQDWRAKEKDTLQKLKLKEIEDGISESGEIIGDFDDSKLLDEAEIEGMPRRKKEEEEGEEPDIFSDPGFLEF